MPTISARLPTIVGIEALKREYQTLGGLVDMNWAAAKKELWNVLHVVIKGDESGQRSPQPTRISNLKAPQRTVEFIGKGRLSCLEYTELTDM